MSIFEVAKQLDAALRGVWSADGWSTPVGDVYRINVESKNRRIIVRILKKARGTISLHAAFDVFVIISGNSMFSANAGEDIVFEWRDVE